jgi:hypothetical protein
MKINNDITIELSPEDLRKIIREHYKNKYDISLIGFKVDYNMPCCEADYNGEYCYFLDKAILTAKENK